MPIYDYTCRSCGAGTELDRLPAEGADMRHLVEGQVCGTFRRDWSSINVNTTNLRSARD
jgi:hypothetical protein